MQLPRGGEKQQSPALSEVSMEASHMANKQPATLHGMERSFRKRAKPKVLGKASLKKRKLNRQSYDFLSNSGQQVDLQSCVAVTL